MENKINFIGKATLTIGIITFIISVLSVLINLSYLMFATPLCIVGLILGSIYTFLNTEHAINTSTINPALIGMLLSSTPIIIVLSIILLNHFKIAV